MCPVCAIRNAVKRIITRHKKHRLFLKSLHRIDGYSTRFNRVPSGKISTGNYSVSKD